MQNQQKIFTSIIWNDSPDRPGERASILAENLSDAKAKLEEKYGENCVYNLYNDEDSDKIR